MYKKAKFLFFCMIFVGQTVLSQNLSPVTTQVTLFKLQQKPLPISLLPNYKVVESNTSLPFLSANYYASKLGFFCKQELKFEKVVKIPFKFRLGSVDECDKLEGKRHYRN